MKKADQPAFPGTTWQRNSRGSKVNTLDYNEGITKREYFAAKAMQGLIPIMYGKAETIEQGDSTYTFTEAISTAAYQVADAMIAETAK